MSTSILSLTDAKTALRYPNPSAASSDDTAIQWFIDAAADVARYHCDTIDVQTFVEKYNGGDVSIFLRNVPVIEVSEVIETWPDAHYSLDLVDPALGLVTSAFAYSLDNAETGQITRRAPGGYAIRFIAVQPNGVQVTYRAGEASTPPVVKLAAIQLVQHWWQNSMLRTMATSNQFAAFDASAGAGYSREPDSQPIDFGVPFRLVQMFRSHSRMPVIA